MQVAFKTGFIVLAKVVAMSTNDFSWLFLSVAARTLSIHSVIECPLLSNPSNGVVILSDTLPPTANYTCDIGHDLNTGAEFFIRTCMQNEVWTGSEPTCNRK